VLAARRIADRLRALPNLSDASVSTASPLSGAISFRDLRVPGLVLADSAQAYTLFAGIDRHYFTTLGIRVVRGRAFTEQDLARRDVAMVNETLAKRYFGSLDPLGRHIITTGYPLPLEVIGVVQDIRGHTASPTAEPETYVPIAAEGAQNLSLIARVVHGDPLIAIRTE
jgi:hypothetical protein